MERNIYDKKDCLEKGMSAEEQFHKIAEDRDWKVTRSTSEQDINEHWDFLIEKDDEAHKVDVKAMKRMKRHDDEVQDKWVWIELHGVRPYDKGWVYAAKSDLIAFEKRNSFLIVKRSDLIELIPKIIDMNSLVRNVRDAKYKIYQRENRPDKISLIEIEKLNPIKWDEWEKTPS